MVQIAMYNSCQPTIVIEIRSTVDDASFVTLAVRLNRKAKSSDTTTYYQHR